MTLAIKQPEKEIPFQYSHRDKARPKQHVTVVVQPSTRKEFPESEANHGSYCDSDASTNQPRFPCIWDLAERLGHVAVKKPSVGAVADEFHTCEIGEAERRGAERHSRYAALYAKGQNIPT